MQTTQREHAPPAPLTTRACWRRAVPRAPERWPRLPGRALWMPVAVASPRTPFNPVSHTPLTTRASHVEDRTRQQEHDRAHMNGTADQRRTTAIGKSQPKRAAPPPVFSDPGAFGGPVRGRWGTLRARRVRARARWSAVRVPGPGDAASRAWPALRRPKPRARRSAVGTLAWVAARLYAATRRSSGLPRFSECCC